MALQRSFAKLLKLNGLRGNCFKDYILLSEIDLLSLQS